MTDYFDIYYDDEELEVLDSSIERFGKNIAQKGEYRKKGKGLLVIGDTHFENKAYQQGEDLINRCVEIAKKINPFAIILLGDIQHTHETAKQSPFEQACRFIQNLSNIAPTYVQIGNHDLINQTQFLSDKHFFNPLKRWEDVVIVDVPTVLYVPIDADGSQAQVIMCPYTPPGRLIEALDTLASPTEDQEEGIDWTSSACIFGHQEIRGVLYGGKPSTSGDTWEPSFPMFISGHIHTECNIGDNVMYTGSSRQVSFVESPDKKIWHVMFEDPDQMTGSEAPNNAEDGEYEVYYDSKADLNRNLWIKKINLNIKGIKDVRITYDEIKIFDIAEAIKTHYITLHIKGTTEQFKVFKKSQKYAKMIREGINVRFDTNTDDRVSPLNILVGENSLQGINHGSVSFESIFHLLVQTKADVVQEAYASLYNTQKKKVVAKMVFVGKK